MSNHNRRYEDTHFERRRDRELLEAANKYEEHEKWCPECRDYAYRMCQEGLNLLEAVYLVLRSKVA